MPKILKTGMDGNIINRSKPKSTTKIKIWDDTVTREYWLQRDRLIYKTTKDEQTKRDILERYATK